MLYNLSAHSLFPKLGRRGRLMGGGGGWYGIWDLRGYKFCGFGIWGDKIIWDLGFGGNIWDLGFEVDNLNILSEIHIFVHL